jgi:hypothetical protein
MNKTMFLGEKLGEKKGFHKWKNPGGREVRFWKKKFLSENIRRLSDFTTEHQKNMYFYFVQNCPLIAEKRPCRKRVFFLDA